MTTWQLEVLGKARFRGESLTFTPERKMAALLAYLALEGPTPRSRLVGLFWPDSPERTARNNLAQLTVRLKKLTGTPLLTGTDTLQVTSALGVDAAALKVAMLTGEHRTIIDAFGPLLATYDYDDLPEFEEWLLAERERLSRLYGEALSAEIARLEGNGEYREAILRAERLLSSDPISEASHRHLMRLHYLAGDRPAAFGVYARLKETLWRELGVEPLPETVGLAREIEQDVVVPEVKRQPTPVPLRVLRPPLVGRDQEWAHLEEAWERGQAVFLSGPPGVGKTRLALDFAASKGPYQLFEARAGDADVPFAYQTRVWRQCLAANPEITLEPWVRRELSRLLPELAETPPPPLRSEEDRLRLYEAMTALMWLATGFGIATVVVNDIHYADAASAEASRYLAEQYVPSEGVKVTPTITTFRTGELDEARLRGIEALQAQGYALHLELSPLERRDIASLVNGLELSEVTPASAPRLTDYLYRTTGGNPLFVVETLKSLLERECLAAPPPSPLTSERVTTLLKGRLARLSAGAQRLAWTAAVAGSDFGPELAASVLETDPFDLAGPWGELEAAGMLCGERFSHDLLAETTLQNVPTPVKTLLHRRCAAYLETQGGNPARIAQHYLEVGNEGKAAPLLFKAAENAKAAFQLAEAAALYEQTGNMLEAQGKSAEAFEAFFEQAVLAISHGMKGDKEAVLAKLFRLARTPLEKAKAQHARATRLNAQGLGIDSERAAREGYSYALATGDLPMQAKLQSSLGEALYLQGLIVEASAVMKTVCELWEGMDEEAELAASLSDVAVMLDLQNRYQEAAHHYRRADELAARLGDKAKRVTTLSNFGFSLRNAGFTRLSIEPLMKAKELLEEILGSTEKLRRNLGQLGESHAQLANYALALDYLQQAIALSEEHDLPHGFLHCSAAEVYISLGQFKCAEASIEAALQQPGLRDRLRGVIWLTKARVLVLKGGDAWEAFSQAEALMDLENDVSGRGQFRIAQGPILPPARFLEHAQEALEIARRDELGALLSGAETRCAQALLALGQPGEALRHSALAVKHLETYDPLDFYLGEVLFTHYRALEASRAPIALEQLQRCLEWVLDVADHRVPSKYRGTFLQHNPTNYAVLKAARIHHLLDP